LIFDDTTIIDSTLDIYWQTQTFKLIYIVFCDTFYLTDLADNNKSSSN